MRSAEKRRDNFRIPLMLAFRQGIDGDPALKAGQQYDPDEIISARGSGRGNAVAVRALKADLSTDITALLSSIDLGSTIDLAGLAYVEKSILNYGMSDLSRLSVGSMKAKGLNKELRLALVRHEPRIVPDSLVVHEADDNVSPEQTIKYSVSGEMICQPKDVPYEFEAECDIAEAKLEVSRRG